MRLFNDIKGNQLTGDKKVRLLFTPDHFNYTINQSTFGDSFSRTNNGYFVDYRLSRNYYQNIYPEYENQWKFTPEDYYKFDNIDDTVNQIYSNGDFWMYYIKK